MTTADKLIAKYTGCDIDLRTLPDAAPQLAELLWRTGYSSEGTEDGLRQHVRILHEATTKIDASVDPEPGQQVPELNPLGELQGHGGRVDLLIALRHQQVETVRGLPSFAGRWQPIAGPEPAGYWPSPHPPYREGPGTPRQRPSRDIRATTNRAFQLTRRTTTMEHVTSGSDEPISVADHKQRKTRILSRQCESCIFKPGNPMMLEPGRLRDMVDEAHSRQGFIVCHDTLPYGPHPGYGPAVCRGFYDRYDTQALQLARRLWGIVEVPPPAAAATEQLAPARIEPAEATRAVPLPLPPTTCPRPLVFVDVDGVLSPDGSRQKALGYRPHRFDGIGPDGQPAGGIVWLHPEHGAWLAEFEPAGARPVWSTSWGTLANTWISPRLGLPGTWPVVDVQGRSGVRWGHAIKLDPITAYAGDSPFLLLDDQVGGKDHDWAAERTAGGAPTLLVAVNPYTGLTRSDIDRVLDWLASLPSGQAA